MNTYISIKRTPLKFFALVYALSIPFWVLGYFAADLTKILPIKLPISALMTFCPLIAAIMLVHKEQKMKGVKELLKQSFDYKKIKDKRWYLPVVFLMPVVALLSYWYMKLTGEIPPAPQMSLLSVTIFFFVYFIGAIGEEIGWSGYLIGPMQHQYGAFAIWRHPAVRLRLGRRLLRKQEDTRQGKKI